MKYHFFWGGPFSNWYPARIEYKGHEFKTTEHAFMWEKANFFNDELTASNILRTTSPADAKKLGREVKNFNSDEWSKVSFDIMVNINIAKFEQHLDLQKILCRNDNFVEASPYDVIWGIGLGLGDPDINDESKWRGQNLLGKALMQVKKEIESRTPEY